MYALESNFAAARFRGLRKVSFAEIVVRSALHDRAAALYRLRLRRIATPDRSAQEPRSWANILGRGCRLPCCPPPALACRKSMPRKILLLHYCRRFSWAYRLPWWPIVRAHNQ